jgi:hypothetical protein
MAPILSLSVDLIGRWADAVSGDWLIKMPPAKYLALPTTHQYFPPIH